MVMVNEYDKLDSITKSDYRILLQLLNPTAPHITEELNEKYALGPVICESNWPEADESKLVVSTMTIGVQVNGKLRGTIDINVDEDEESIKKKAMEVENVSKFIEGHDIVKIIVIKNKIVNIVIK